METPGSCGFVSFSHFLGSKWMTTLSGATTSLSVAEGTQIEPIVPGVEGGESCLNIPVPSGYSRTTWPDAVIAVMGAWATAGAAAIRATIKADSAFSLIRDPPFRNRPTPGVFVHIMEVDGVSYRRNAD